MFFLTAAVAVLALQQDAAAQQQIPEARFGLSEAAHCAAFYSLAAGLMQNSPDIPARLRSQTELGFAAWNYELNVIAAQPGADIPAIQNEVNKAQGYVRAGMPTGQGPDGAAARGNYAAPEIAACAEKIRTTYADTVHPVVEAAQRQEVAVTASQPPRADEPAKGRGLR